MAIWRSGELARDGSRRRVDPEGGQAQNRGGPHRPRRTGVKGLLRAGLSDDDLHPNAKGYQVMAPLAEAAVAGVLGTKR